MMVDYIVYHLFNDLANKANSNHTHTGYASSSHTHTEYVTSNQVTSLVNTAIESGDISMSGGNPFKSIETYTAKNNTTGTTITGGPGIVTVVTASVGSTGTGVVREYPYLNIDDTQISTPSSGAIYLFKSTCKISTSGASYNANITIKVGIFD